MTQSVTSSGFAFGSVYIETRFACSQSYANPNRLYTKPCAEYKGANIRQQIPNFREVVEQTQAVPCRPVTSAQQRRASNFTYQPNGITF